MLGLGESQPASASASTSALPMSQRLRDPDVQRSKKEELRGGTWLAGMVTTLALLELPTAHLWAFP